MKTNLIFKRSVDGKIEMIMVPVEIPLNKTDGWTLASCCDTFTVLDGEPETPAQVTSTAKVVDETIKTEEEIVLNNVPQGGSYQSKTPGTARLVRYKDKIRITYRKGKTTLNRNDPNSVCINDAMKQEFFNSVKREYGSDVTVWQLVSGDTDYDHFNNLIDKLYEQGRIEYNNALVVSG